MNRDFADLSGFHEFTRRTARNNKRLADGALGGGTNLASPVAPPQMANQPRIVESLVPGDGGLLVCEVAFDVPVSIPHDTLTRLDFATPGVFEGTWDFNYGFGIENHPTYGWGIRLPDHGVYRVEMSVLWDANATGLRYAEVFDAGGVALASDFGVMTDEGATNHPGRTLFRIEDVLVIARVRQTSGGNLSVFDGSLSVTQVRADQASGGTPNGFG